MIEPAMESPPRFFNISGEEITLNDWRCLRDLYPYMSLAATTVGSVYVATYWTGAVHDHQYDSITEKPQIFETLVDDWGKMAPKFFKAATEEEALGNHYAMVNYYRNGKGNTPDEHSF